MDVYADVLRYWDLFSDLFRRDFAVRFRGSALGVAWTLVNPLLLMGVYTVLFSFLIKAPGIDSIPNYPLFVLTGPARVDLLPGLGADGHRRRSSATRRS